MDSRDIHFVFHIQSNMHEHNLHNKLAPKCCDVQRSPFLIHIHEAN
jgi:hypothetical protein